MVKKSKTRNTNSDSAVLERLSSSGPEKGPRNAVRSEDASQPPQTEVRGKGVREEDGEAGKKTIGVKNVTRTSSMPIEQF